MLKNWWTVLAMAAILCGTGLALSSASSNATSDEAAVLVGHRDDDGAVSFSLEGKSLRGLYPGAVKQMHLTVVNPNRFRMSLHQLSGKVVGTSRRDCPATASNLVLETYTGALPAVLDANSRSKLAGTVPVRMPIGASPKCAGALFTITLTGRGYGYRERR